LLPAKGIAVTRYVKWSGDVLSIPNLNLDNSNFEGTKIALLLKKMKSQKCNSFSQFVALQSNACLMYAFGDKAASVCPVLSISGPI
jgi:hypothetical protein